MNKPSNPYPKLIRCLLKKVLPSNTYRHYIGRHEDESMRLWMRIATKVIVGRAILDIGAFKGDYALAARHVNSVADIYAFEPNPHSFIFLRSACENKNIHICNTALSEENGELPFLCHAAESRILKQGAHTELQDEIIYIPALTLDYWVAENSIVPSLIKIDVEGAEAGILRNAQEVLNNSSPIILCEILSDQAGDEVMMALPQHYHFYYIDENRGISESLRITRRKWRNKNWLLVPENNKAQVFA
jgi:FkbM family methyltransferase